MCKVATGKQLTEIEKVRQEFDKAWKELSDKGIDTVVENAKAKNNTAENDGVKYSIKTDDTGKKYVEIDKDIYAENPGVSIASTIAQYISENYNNLITVNGQKIQVNAKTNREWRRSEYANKLLKNDSDIYANKLKTIANADEILKVAKDWISEKPYHKRKDDIVEFGRGLVNYKVGNKGYSADVLVGIRTNGSAVLYDIVNISEKNITEAQVAMESENSQRSQDTSVINYSISNPNENVNTRFSLSESNNTLEKVEKTLYNKNNPLSIVDRASKNNNSSINWVYKAEIFSVKENMLFHEMISEINQGSQAFGKNSIDEYMLPIGNKIVFTDGNYDLPYVREVIEVLTEYQTEFEDIKRCIYSVEKGESTKHETARIIRQMYGEGIVVSYNSRNNGVYGWEDRRRKGKTRRTVVKNYLNKHYGRGNDSQINETKAGLNRSASFMPDDIAPVRKSLSNTDEQSTTVGTPLKDLAFDEDIAPVRESIVENATVNEDLAPVKYEAKTNAISRPLDSYPVEKQKVIRSYIHAVDKQIKSFVEKVKNGNLSFERKKISNVSRRAVEDIKKLLGIDVTGYTNNINTSGVQHIIVRHGENGKQDTTMSIDDDIARVGWVLENYDSVELLTEKGKQSYSSSFMDKKNNPAPQIRFIKKIDGTYYVVEAVFENDYKKIWVQSTYLQKNEDVAQASAEGNTTTEQTPKAHLLLHLLVILYPKIFPLSTKKVKILGA